MTIVVLAFGLTQRLEAQQPRDVLSLDLTIGRGTGSGGNQRYVSSDGIAAEMTLAFRPHPDHALGWMAAVALGRRSGPLDLGDLQCIVRIDANTGCLPGFPTFSHVGLIGGGEWRVSHLAVRALVGPAWYAGGGPSGVGAQAHGDVAIGFRHVALVAAARRSWVERVSHETLRCRSLEFGLRVQ
jgi:hypothetical protein